MKKRMLLKSNTAWAAVLGILGFTGCKPNGTDVAMYSSPVPEYAAPYASHIISGKVTNEAETPIKGIKIEVVGSNYGYDDKAIYTDENGDYIYSDNNAWPEMEYSLTFTDIDGEENGGDFETKSIEVEFVNKDFTGGDGNWYDGEAQKTLDVTLAEKEPEEAEI